MAYIYNILIIFEAQFEHNIKNLQKMLKNPKILRTLFFEAEPNFTGSYNLSQFFLTITGICYKGNDTLVGIRCN